jgi:hypothetical protein
MAAGGRAERTSTRNRPEHPPREVLPCRSLGSGPLILQELSVIVDIVSLTFRAQKQTSTSSFCQGVSHDSANTGPSGCCSVLH